ncbi:MAG: amino acid adenylation domain-containing protein [Bacillales bacterium]|nr:amino acid adenylation domain-containing protein [Bacillales bacterium]
MEKSLVHLQENIKEIFEQELNIEIASTDENFFAMGGNSILAVKILQKIRKTFSVTINFQDIFDYPTIALLAARIQELQMMQPNNFFKISLPKYDVTEKYFPLTPIQKAYLLGRETVLGSYGVSSHFYIELERDELDIEILEDTWNLLIGKYEALRIVMDKKTMSQYILEKSPKYRLEFYDFGAQEDKFLELRKQMETQVLDVERWPIFDIRISKSMQHNFCIHISFDNLILDGSSICLLLDEWEYLYNGNKFETVNAGKPFRDYVESLSLIKDTENYRVSEVFWREKIRTIAGKPELPILNKNITGEFFRMMGILPAEKWNHIKSLANAYGLTPSSILLTAFSEILYRWCSEKKFTINVTVNKKGLYDTVYESVLGEFTDIVLVSIENGKEITFIDKCKAVQSEVVQNMNYSYFDGLEIQRIWTKENEVPLGNAFPIVFTSMLGSADSLSMPGKYTYGLTQTPQVWLDYQVREYKGELYFNWDVLKGKFHTCMIQHMFECYQQFLDSLDQKELWEKPMRSHIKILSETVPKTELDTTLLSENNLYEYFYNSYKKSPDNIAIIYDNSKYSYRDCKYAAKQLSVELLHSKRIGIFLEKGIKQVESVLAATMVGATYIPIDIHNPEKRVHTIIKEAEIDVLITSRRLLNQMENQFNTKCICVEEISQKINYRDVDYVRENQIAYIIFTSGSTGIPKGVVISNRAANNTILDINKRYSVGSNDRVLALSNIAFDLSVYDVFGMFEAGAAIVVPREEDVKNPRKWVELIHENFITIWNSVPTFMEMLCTYVEMNDVQIEKFATVRLILLSGDKINKDLPSRIHLIMPQARIVCLGGATEAAIWSNYYEPKAIDVDWPSIPYGYPLTNQKYYILNEDLLLCPEYVEGELYIAGAGLADGYLNHKDLTERKFLYNNELGERIYKTGDRGKLIHGCIWFLGRQDTQIKKRGYRIELGEIENVLQSIEYVKQAKVGYKDYKIYAFVCAKGTNSIDLEKLMASLKKKMPDYYLPDTICVVSEMPLNENGKVDLKQLWANLQKGENGRLEEEFLFTELEKSIGQIWKEVLKYKNKFLRNDDFFQCGGDSLRAVEVVSRINKNYPNVKLEMKDLFLNSTIKTLSTEIEQRLVESSLLDEGAI